MTDKDDLVCIESSGNQIRRPRTYKEIKEKIRKELLIELSNIFKESLNTKWHNWEVSDFLDTYK